MVKPFVCNVKSITRTAKGAKIVLDIPDGYPVPAIPITTVNVTIEQSQQDLFKGDGKDE